MKEILLIGGGGHCKSVIDVIEQEGQFQIVGIIDKAELFGLDDSAAIVSCLYGLIGIMC